MKELELFRRNILNIPMIKSCEFNCICANHSTECLITLKNGNQLQLNLHVLKNGYPKSIKEQLVNISDQKYHVVFAPFITEKSEQIFEELSAGYMDYAGNCLINHEFMYLHITGNKNVHVQKRALRSVFERSSIVSSKILRVMFEDLNKSWKLKELSKIVNCSIGQVSKIKDFLLKHAWIEQNDEGISIIDPVSILEEWSKVYNNKENEIYEFYSLDNIPTIEMKLQKMKEEIGINYYLTGFSGGVRYQPVVRYQKVHCYINANDLDKAIEYLGCKKVESGSNLSLIVPYDECILNNSREINHSYVVSPLQIYLDCMNLKGRGEELANEILIKEIVN